MTTYGQSAVEWEKTYVNISKITGYSRAEIMALPVTRFLVLINLVKSEGKKWARQF